MARVSSPASATEPSTHVSFGCEDGLSLPDGRDGNDASRRTISSICESWPFRLVSAPFFSRSRVSKVPRYPEAPVITTFIVELLAGEPKNIQDAAASAGFGIEVGYCDSGPRIFSIPGITSVQKRSSDFIARLLS